MTDDTNGSSSSLPLALQAPDTALTIRDVTPADAERLHAGCWSHRTLTRCRELIQRILDADAHHKGVGAVLYPPDTPDQVFGYGQLRRWTRCAEISDLIIAENERGKGYGTALIQHLVSQRGRLTHATCIEIGAAISNPRALALYRRLGFRESYSIHLKMDGKAEPVIYLRLYPDNYAST